MPLPSRTSRLTGRSVPDFFIHAHARHFNDTAGRTLILRGVNLSSSSKIPRGHPQHVLRDFWESAEQDGTLPEPSGSSPPHLNHSPDSSLDSSGSLYRKDHQGISYVGQTLDLEDGSADVHLTRLRQWGFNCIRFVTVWEALEHKGPGQYDDVYMDYVVAVLRKCKEFGFKVYMDPHQDLFSRFCGGSGAPLWTLYACGLNPRNFTATGAAYLQAEWPNTSSPEPESFPSMVWATNYSRLACQTVNTMFWSGRDFAPLCIIDGINIQDYLQYHFLEAFRRLAMKISNAGDLFDETVIGWDSLNEPNHGYLGLQDLSKIPDHVPLRIGPMPAPIQGMKLGMGGKETLDKYKFGPIGPQRDGQVLVDPKGERVWLDPAAEPNGRSGYGWRRDPGWRLGTCIWAQHGVWDILTGQILETDYFGRSRVEEGKKVDFATDYWRPHLNAYSHMIRQIHEEAILFVHPPVFEIPPELNTEVLPILKDRSVFSSHFYDGLTLVTRHWNWFNADALGILRGNYPSVIFGLKIGEAAIRRCLRSQLAMLRQDGLEKMGEFPTMMGEIGIPYDLDKKQAFKDGDYSNQVKAMDASLNACDGENMLNYTIWTYCPDNSHTWGDLWNGEDLSLWSASDADCHKGNGYAEVSTKFGRTLARPYQYTYGGRSNAPTPDGSAVTLLHHRNQPTEVNKEIKMNMNLNDGARALAAFCRPFPIATVGTPVYFNFDIASATFEMTVEVNGLEEDEAWVSGLFTEIYVPAAHFGAQVGGAGGGMMDSSSLSSIELKGSVEDLMGDSRLQIEVTVSGGRWESEGQLVRWFYPKRLAAIKPGGAGSPGDSSSTLTDVVRHTIKVRRKPGPIVWEDDRIWRIFVFKLGHFLIAFLTGFGLFGWIQRLVVGDRRNNKRNHARMNDRQKNV